MEAEEKVERLLSTIYPHLKPHARTRLLDEYNKTIRGEYEKGSDSGTIERDRSRLTRLLGRQLKKK